MEKGHRKKGDVGKKVDTRQMKVSKERVGVVLQRMTIAKNNETRIR